MIKSPTPRSARLSGSMWLLKIPRPELVLKYKPFGAPAIA
jgi:hypothetical protein